MAARRAGHLPIAFVVVSILILGAVVAIVSFRDIGRGRAQVAEILSRQAGGVMAFVAADLHAELVAPAWQRSRIERFFQNVIDRENVAYVAILDGDRHVLVHSDPGQVGSVWSGPLRPGPRGRRPEGVVVTVEGRTIHQFAVALDVHPERVCRAALMQGRGPGRFGRGPMECAVDPQTVAARLSDLTQRRVTAAGPVDLIAVVGLDASDLEAGFLASRNHTVMLSALLLLVGAAGIYFLFTAASYRSVRTALATMQSYTTNLVENMPSGLVSVGPDGRVVTVNSRARSMLSITDGARDRSVDEVLSIEPPEDREAVGAVIAGKAGPLKTETRVTVGGVSVPIELSASPLAGEDGRHAGAALLFQDLRELEALREEVERERHLASLGRLAAGVAHEVRNPLSSLKGFAQLFRSRFAPGSEEERHADIMIEEVERLDRVVEELLDFAKPSRPDRRPADANEIVRESVALVLEDAAFRKVSVQMKLADGLPAVLVDRRQIRQALLNLLLNGIDAAGEGGTVVVETALQAGSGAAHVAVGVRDNGPGLEQDEIARIFEPFYTTKPSGTGLGLTIVSRILEQNGARVSVTSAKGRGSTFSVRVPVAGRADAAEGRAA
ncbi:MAG: PAS domain-containing protein [Candidatus Eisenbacteria bacterium]|nr:PAS domain-containing protein [Candidatus Eisenbacteria bacterium]